MDKLNIVYINEKDIPEERCNVKMDTEFKKVAKQFRYIFIGSGYDFKSKERFLEFDKGKCTLCGQLLTKGRKDALSDYVSKLPNDARCRDNRTYEA